MRTYRELFRTPEFTPFFAAASVQTAAQTATGLALGTLVYARTGSPLLSALAMFGPSLAQVAGALTLLSAADRLPPRVRADRSRPAVGGGRAVCRPSRAAVVGGVRGSAGDGGGRVAGRRCAVRAAQRDRAARGVPPRPLGAEHMAGGAMQICGFAVGGALVAVSSARGTLLIGAALYVVAAAVTRLGLTARPARATGRPSVRETWRTKRVALVVHAAPVRLPRPLGSQRARRRLRVPVRGVRARARRAPLRRRGPGDARRGHAGRAVRHDPVAGPAGSSAATAAGRALICSSRWARGCPSPWRWSSWRVSASRRARCSSERLLALTPQEPSGQALGLSSSGMLAMQVGAAVAGGIAQLTCPATGHGGGRGLSVRGDAGAGPAAYAGRRRRGQTARRGRITASVPYTLHRTPRTGRDDMSDDARPSQKEAMLSGELYSPTTPNWRRRPCTRPC